MDKTLQKIDIFVSSPSDVRAEREIAIRVVERLNRMDHIATHFVLKPLAYERIVPPVIGDRPQPIVDKYMTQASRADLFICILWTRMGTPVTDEQTGEQYDSGTHYEFLSAYRANQEHHKPHILLYRGKKPISPDADPEQLGRVQAFFRQFEGADAGLKGLYKSYETLEEFEETLFHDLDRVLTTELIQTDRVGATTIGSRRHDFYQQVVVPTNYVPRQELLDEVRTALIAERTTLTPTATASINPLALHGMGGIGKSVIARALCDDPLVQATFPDGILWVTLGQEPQLVTKLREWLTALGGTISENAPTEDSLKENLARLLAERACLLVVDDVWKKRHADPFRVGGVRCRLLITTRDTELARELGARIQPVPRMTQTEAIQLLDDWADGKLAGADPALKVEIGDRLGRLPLALKLAGAQLQRKTADEWLATFDARKLRAKRPEDVHDSLEQTFGLSLDSLQANERRLYSALSIFRKGETIPEDVISRLWSALGRLDTGDTIELVDDLAARALLEVVRASYPRAVLLHDLLLDFMSAELADNHEVVHRELVNVYRRTQNDLSWASAPDDGYLYDHLVYHLEAIGAWDELKTLFANQAWLNVRVPQCQFEYDGYLADLVVVWEASSAETKAAIESNQPPLSFANCFRYALIATSVNSIASNFPPELIVRAVELGLWKAKRALSIANKVSNPIRRTSFLLMLLKLLPTADRQEAVRLALETAITILDSRERIRSLVTVLPYLDDDLRDRAMNVIISALPKIRDRWEHADAVAIAAPHLSVDHRGEIIEWGIASALKLRDKDDCAVLLCRLSPYLDQDRHAEILKTVSDLTTSIKIDRDRARVLRALIAVLDEHERSDVLAQGLAAAKAVHNAQIRAETLIALVGYLDPAQATEILGQALADFEHIEDAQHRAEALITLLGGLKDDHKAEAVGRVMEAIQSVKDNLDKVELSARLLPHLDDRPRIEILENALAAAFGIEYAKYRAVAFSSLAPFLNAQQVELCLRIALSVGDEWRVGQALVALIPHLGGSAREEAIEFARDVTRHLAHELDRARILEKLAPYLENNPGVGAYIPEESASAVEQAPAEPHGQSFASSALQQAVELSQLLTTLSDAGSTIRTIRSLLVDYLLEIKNQRRGRTLELCATGSPLLAPGVLTPEILHGIAREIIDLYQNWHWL